MSQAQLTLSVRKVGDRACFIDIKGDVSGAAENALTDAYTQASAGGVQAIILNFAEMEYMNSSGIGLLGTLLIRANRNKQRLLAVGLSDHYKQIFELTRLDGGHSQLRGRGRRAQGCGKLMTSCVEFDVLAR